MKENLRGLAGAGAEDLGVAAEAAYAGGRSVVDLYADDPEIRSGQWGGPVTEADRASHAVILEILARAVPEDRIVSEEDEDKGPAPGGGGRLWLVDPLDGTREYIARNGEFSVMVGLAVEGRATVGAVYQPVPGRLFLGVVGGGSWVVDGWDDVSGKARSLRVGTEVRRSLRVVRSRSHGDERLARLEELPGGVDWVVSGSVGIKCALIAEDRADLYVHPVPYLKEWDTCAPEAVLAGAGGRVTDCHGEPLTYGKTDPHQPGGIFAARPDAWELAAPVVGRLMDRS
ncbi:MAG: 3'(2'),5'-bisphosphate nucleotidase CysQ family protein [Gemmatimonadota bacterium]